MDFYVQVFNEERDRKLKEYEEVLQKEYEDIQESIQEFNNTYNDHQDNK